MKKVVEEFNDLNELHYAVKTFINKDNGEAVNYNEFRYYYAPNKYFVVTCNKKDSRAKDIMRKLVANAIIIEDTK